MKHQGGDYRVSLLTAAQHHGAAAEASRFQVIVPRQLRDLAIGGHRLEFIPQTQSAFTRTNRAEWLAQMKTTTSPAIAAGIELARHEEQAKALDPFARKATLKLVDPSSKLEPGEMSGRWKIAVNNPPKP